MEPMESNDSYGFCQTIDWIKLEFLKPPYIRLIIIFMKQKKIILKIGCKINHKLAKEMFKIALFILDFLNYITYKLNCVFYSLE
ncbi:MAG: hypothetical protein HeimC3_36930 [Candidatus Heimdallarchaeota archaeon LC_3]|nr:MAG: hypothetical protein HeimC3_36930 [Candidatus Heimdallarchaeota archaeon LC_3]